MPSHLDRAQLLMDVHRPKEAARALLDYLAQEPDSARGHAQLARCFLDLKKYKEAQVEIERAIEIAPENAYGHYIHSFVLRDLQRPQEARRAIDEALRLAPNDADCWSQSAGLACGAESYEDALRAADCGLQAHPTHVGCACHRAFALMCLDRHDEANRALEQILAQHPDHARIHATIGWVAIHAGRYSAARDHFSEALRIAPENTWAEEGLKASYLRWFRHVRTPSESIEATVRDLPLATLAGAGYFLLAWLLPWLESISKKSSGDLAVKSWIFIFPLFVCLVMDELDTLSDRMLPTLLRRPRRPGRQIVWRTLAWIALALAAAASTFGELQKSATFSSLGCVLLAGVPLLILSSELDGRAAGVLRWNTAYFLTGLFHVLAAAYAAQHGWRTFGPLYWSTLGLHWATATFIWWRVCRTPLESDAASE